MLHVTRSRDVIRALGRAGVDALDDVGARSVYSTDASVYRIPPLAVTRPADAEQVERIVDVARRFDVPLTARGAGTSVAGNAIGRGIVVDFSRRMNAVLAIDPAARTARVQPGVVHADLQRAARPHGLRFGPDPSTHSRCTIGGMIGNNACGARSLAYGRTADNVVALELLDAAGGRVSTGYRDGSPVAAGADRILADLRATMSRRLAVARTEFGRFGRQVSGYAVENLVPERGYDLTRTIVGSEGTLALVTEATVRLVEEPGHRVLVAIGFADIAAAGDAAPATLAVAPTACEGLDARIVEVVRHRRGPAAVPPLPRGAAWLLVELAGHDPEDVLSRAEALAAARLGLEHRIVSDPREIAVLWGIREAGAGLAGRAPSERPAWAGWEDAAVPPDRLGGYLRRFDALMDEHGLTGMPFGHFGEGCIHVRLDYPLDAGGTAAYRRFVEDAADLVAGFGGSLSGEHGDGRARSELLPRMYSPAAIELFRAVKRTFDPEGRLNPGVLVDPDPLDAQVRTAVPLRAPRSLGFAYRADGGDFAQAVHRCTGVGSCRADNSASGGVMCPSYRATREDRHSTRGRARLLEEAIRGDRLLDWRSPELHDALDLCLSCKGCTSDCPTGVDLPTWKSEALHQRYRGRLRPRAHYSLGMLPRWSRIARHAPWLANLATSAPGIRKAALALAGVDDRRAIPRFAARTFRDGFRRRPRVAEGKPVVLFVDSFSDHFQPEVPWATVEVLEAAGYTPRLPAHDVCCGLTWITTGQLDGAKRILARTVGALAADALAGIPIVGVEPSCTAVLRSDLAELVDSPAARAVADATRTLAELLVSDPTWRPPDLSGARLLAQPHCHHRAVMGWSADERLLAAAGAEVTEVAGCCGLAGSFGIERGHYEVSVAVAELDLLPAVRAAAPGTVVLADGFSCRTQLDDLAGVPSRHLAQVLADAVRQDSAIRMPPA